MRLPPTSGCPGTTHTWIWPQLGLTSSNKDLFHFYKCVFLTSIVAEHQRNVLVTADKRHEMKSWNPWLHGNHGKSRVFKEANICDLERCHCWIWSTGGLYSHSPGTSSLHRPQHCYAPFYSRFWINKAKHPQHAAPRAAMSSQIFHLWFLPPENVSDSQQGGLTEQPKHSLQVISTERRKRVILK